MAALESALHRQQLRGGSLDTALLELGLVDPATLGKWLIHACGLPLAPMELLDGARVRPWHRLPAGVVPQNWIVPLDVDGEQLIVAVHPDLPKEFLNELYVHIPGVQLFVAPECCIETILAERASAGSPQPFASLCAAYLDGRRRSELHATQRGASAEPEDDEFEHRPTLVFAATPPHPPVVAAPSLTSTDQPEAIAVPPTAAPALDAAPPVRFAPGAKVQQTPGSQERFVNATSRDAVFDVLTEGLTSLGPRVALFRIRGPELIGLSCPGSAIRDVSGNVVAMRRESMLAVAMAAGSYRGPVTDEGLAELVGLQPPGLCLLHRLDVASHPTMFVYFDRGGTPPSDQDRLFVAQLCNLAGTAFARVVKTRQNETPGVSEPPSPRVWQPLHEPLPPAGPIPVSTTAPPPAGRARRPAPTVSYEGTAPQRQVARPQPPIATAAGPQARAHGLTVRAMPPPPGLPPPPPMGAQWAPAPGERLDTLMGLPVGEQDPTTNDQPDADLLLSLHGHVELAAGDSGIIPLAPPIDDAIPAAHSRASESSSANDQAPPAGQEEDAEVDAMLEAIGSGVGSLEAVSNAGTPALMRLCSQFPGKLDIARRELKSLPPPSHHGPLLRTAIRIGAPVVPYLLDLFDHPDPDIRFYAAFVFQELRDTRALRPLAELAFDPNGDVRVVATRVLETYRCAPGFGSALGVVRERLAGPNRSHQLYAARALGTLRDVDAILQLIDLLASRDRFVQEAALESLCSITGQQLGLKPHRWKAWHQSNGERHRVQWLIDSLQHRDAPVRRWAADELARVTGHRISAAPLETREGGAAAGAAWQEWWESRGRLQLATPTK